MPHDYTMIDSDRVIRLTSQKKITMAALARSINVSRTTLWKVMGGHGPAYRCRSDTAQRLADWLGTSLDELTHPRARLVDEQTATDFPDGEAWTVECVLADQPAMSFHARLTKQAGRLELTGTTGKSELSLALVVESGKACGHVRIGQRCRSTILAALWSVKLDDHYLNLEGRSQTSHADPRPILVFARSNRLLAGTGERDKRTA